MIFYKDFLEHREENAKILRPNRFTIIGKMVTLQFGYIFYKYYQKMEPKTLHIVCELPKKSNKLTRSLHKTTKIIMKKV